MAKIKRLGVISDIHGEYDLLIQLLDKIRYNPADWDLIFLGDYVNKGEKSKDVVNLVMKLVKYYNCIAIKGNHDYKLVSWLKGHPTTPSGIDQTLNNYLGTSNQTFLFNKFELNNARRYINKEYSEHVKFLDSLPLFHEDDKHIYVHAGFDPTKRDWKKSHSDKFLFTRKEFYLNPTNSDKVTIFGHTECYDIHYSNDPWFSKDKIAIDGGACRIDGQLNCLEILRNGEYRTHKVSKTTSLGEKIKANKARRCRRGQLWVTEGSLSI